MPKILSQREVDDLMREHLATVSFVGEVPGWRDAPELGEEEDDLALLGELEALGGPGSGNFGHAGRPGQVGGSAPGKNIDLTSSTRADAAEALALRDTLLETVNIRLMDADEGSPELEALREASQAERSVIKAALVHELAGRLEKSGVDLPVYMKTNRPEHQRDYTDAEMKAAEYVDLWAETSGDSHVDAIRMQMAVQEEFNLEAATEHLTGQAENVKSLITPSAVDRAFVRAEYEATQKWFKEQGITHVSVYRGMAEWDSTSTTVNLQPASSWTTNRAVASDFANNAADEWDSDPYVYRSRVPVSRVLSTFVTGRGCLTEEEIILLGGPINAVGDNLLSKGSSWDFDDD